MISPMDREWRRSFLALTVALAAGVARAQFTEAPQTVAPGKWLMETDVATVAIDRHTPARDGVEYRSTYLGYVQLTTGVTESFDVQFGLESWHDERVQGGGADSHLSGMGELYLRAKWKFWDDGKGTALALLPYYRVRDTAARHVRPALDQFGLIIPFSRPLSERWSLSAMTQNDWLDDGSGGRDWWLTANATCLYNAGGRASAYIEGTTWAQGARGRWATMAGIGALWQATDRFSWDLALHVGLNRAAPDWYPVLRFVWEL